MSTKKEVAEQKTKVPAAQSDYGADAGAGMEGMGKEDFLVPFLRILQPLSPEVNENDAKYIQGAKAGMIFNTATREIFEAKEVGIVFVVSYRDHNYVEFVPRDAGGGFVNQWDANDDRLPMLRSRQTDKAAQRGFGKIKLDPGDPASNELAETFYFYGPIVGPNGMIQRVVIGFSSTQIKRYKAMATQLAMLVGEPAVYPTFAFRWRLRSVPDKNKKGQWYSWRIELDGVTREDTMLDPGSRDGTRPAEPLYVAAREFYQLMKKGVLKADMGSMAQEEDAGAGEDPPFEADEAEIPMA